MNRLIAFGCSYTRGTALPDVWDFKNNKSIYGYPSKFAWPSVLAEKLERECINLGKGGASNKLIWHTIINFEFQPNDLVFIHWSYLDRYHFFEDEKTSHIIDHRSINARDKAFFKHLHSEYDMLLDFYLRLNHVDQYLTGKKLKTYHLIVEPSMYKFTPNWNHVKFLNVSLIEYKELLSDRACDGSHPGETAHREFANQIYKII